uniref:Protein kinase Ukc1p n=1 Tax=Ganoderma boninense TaxID=34458 RepID=A0A5K1JUL8_9APHY
MEASSLRPRRPTRAIPQLPPSGTSTDQPLSPASDDAHFATPLTSPIQPDPVHEQPPPLSKPPSSPDATDSKPQHDSCARHELTPIRAHYLKKELIHLEFQRELDALVTTPTNNVSTFSYLGPPFTPPPKDAPRLDLPFLRFFFRRFVLSFPFLASAPKDFFPDKVQPFLASLLSRNLSPTSVLDEKNEQSEEATRHRMLNKLERNLSMLMTSATKLVEPEDVVRLSQADLNRLETLARRRAAKERKMKDSFDVNVVCVRSVTERKRMRSKVHEEFIIRTRRRGQSDVFVSRRYGDFKTLADELRKAHPEEDTPPPPPKDRSFVNVTLSPTPFSLSFPSVLPSPPPSASHSTSSYSRNVPGMPVVSPTSSQAGRGPRIAGRPNDAEHLYEAEQNSSVDSFSLTSPTSPSSGMPGAFNSSSYGGYSDGGGVSQQALRLSREKNRLTLRSYLHTLLSSSVFASSPVLRSFLLSSPTRLTEEELADARRREEADRMREDGRMRFAKEITARVDGLRETVRGVKGELLGKDGLTHIFATIKDTPDVRNLPPSYQAVLEWARISLASTVFHHYVAADNASETFANMKRIHGLMPYFMLKAALKVSNPMGMIRGVLDLFLATPFGGRSLLQRMFTGSLMEEVRAINEDIEAVKEKVDDPVMCEKVRLYVYAPREIQAVYKADAGAENLHVLAVVLRSGDQPPLSRAQFQRVMYAHRAHKEYVRYQESLPDSDDDEGPQEEEAWLFEDLSILAKLYARLKDREQLIELIFEGTTADLLKDIITIFYAPLAQVYRAASVADSLGDFQNFMNDLIRTVEQTEELSQTDPARTVQIFIDLVQRHEQAFYSFVHKVHSKGEGLFTDLMRWIERFLTLMREGVGEQLSLEFLLPHTGDDRENIMHEVDSIALYHYKLKVAYEAKLRRRFGRTQGMNDADAEDEAASQLVNGIVHDLSFGDLVDGDAADLAAQETDEEDSSDDESTSGSGTSNSDSESEEDDSSESETDTDSEGNATERDKAPQRFPSHNTELTQPPTRSHTVGHSPMQKRPSQARLASGARHSEDIPARPPLPPITHSRSRTLSAPGRPPPAASRFKDLPPHPGAKELPPTPPPIAQTPSPAPSARQREKGVERRPPPPKAKPPRKPKKDNNAPTPPELEHIPKLLPLFIEMVRFDRSFLAVPIDLMSVVNVVSR